MSGACKLNLIVKVQRSFGCLKGGGLFTQFKELNSRAKHGQSFKKLFERITVFLCQIHTPKKVSESFFQS